MVPRLALVILALLGTALPPAPVEAPPPSPAPAGEGIPLSAIARSAEDARRRLGEIVATLAPSAEETALAEGLPQAETRVDEQAASLAAARLEMESPSLLSDRRRAWQLSDLELQGWEKTLERAGKAIEEQSAAVNAMSATWEATAIAATSEAAPAAVLERVASTRALLDDASRRLRARRDTILALQDRVERLRGETGDAIAALDRAQTLFKQRIFEVESQPLWTALLSPRRPASLRVELRDSWHRAVVELRAFAGDEGDRLLWNLALFVGLATALLVLGRRRPRGGGSGPEAEAADVVLSRPYASAALVSLVASLWLYVAPPKSFRELVLVVTLIPFLRLLPGLVPRPLHPPLYGLAALFLLDRSRDLLLEHSLVQRLILLGVAAAALAGLAWSLRPGGPAHDPAAGRWWRAARAGSALGGALLALSLVANVFGNVTLSEALARGTLSAAFSAVVLFAVVRVLESAVATAVRSPAAARLRAFRELSAPLRKRGRAWLRIAAVSVWLYIDLAVFHVWGPTVAAVRAAMGAKWVLGEINLSLGALVAFAVTLAVTLALSRAARAILDEAVLPNLDLPRGVPTAISKTVGYGIVAVGGFLSFLAAGFDMTRVTLLAGALGVGIGFGLQNLVNNFVSGVILLYERPIQEGDVITVGTLQGRVLRIGIRSSTVRTFDGAEVIVPNGTLISSEVTNWTLSDRLCRAELLVGVAYGTDPDRAAGVLRSAVTARPGVLATPPPAVLFIGLGDSSLDFSVRFWAPDYDRLIDLKSEVLADLYRALGEAGIEIPFPQRDVHIRSLAPGADGPLVEKP